MNLARPMLIADSFGCQILAEFAARQSGRVDRLVLQGPTVDADGCTLFEQIRRLWRNSQLEKGATAAISRCDSRKVGLRRSWETLQVAIAGRIEETLPKITAPVLVVVGSRAPVAWARRVAALAPMGRLVGVPEAMRTMNYVLLDQFVPAIRPLLLQDTPMASPDNACGPIAS